MAKRILAAFDRGQTPTIACINQSSADLGVDFDKLISALQKYIDQYFAPIWGTPAKLVSAKKFVKNAWAMVFLDNADVEGALGYHDLTPDGLPLGKIFVETTRRSGNEVSVTASHELAEMLVDPAANLCAVGPEGVIYAYEVCDAVEEESFKIDGITMSDFVYPSYFEGFRGIKSTQFDELKKIKKPFEILKGGYMPVFKDGEWTQIFGSEEKRKRWEQEQEQAWVRTQERKLPVLV